MTDPRTPDTTAIRAFAEGMRTSVGLRDELLAAHSHLLALCDALDAERAANAEMRRALELIGHWDCLNPPRSDLLADLPWLRKLVDSGLRAADDGGKT